MDENRESALTLKIKMAFETRRFPDGDILRPGSYTAGSLEARRVREFFRNKLKIDRSSNAQVALFYMTDAAVIAALPLYAISIIENFKREDYLNTCFIDMLSSGAIPQDEDLYEGRGVRLRKMAIQEEANAICAFLKWYFDVAIKDSPIDEEIYGPAVVFATNLWCTG
jgi:hypothetical protein